jgi:lysyl-tRNA synthetase class 2
VGERGCSRPFAIAGQVTGATDECRWRPEGGERVRSAPFAVRSIGVGRASPAISQNLGVRSNRSLRRSFSLRSARWWGGIVVASLGFVDLVSAVTPPLRARFEVLVELLPVEVTGAATGVVVGIGLALLLVARAVFRGRRRAHRAVLAMLALSVVLHLTKALDVEEAILAASALGYLWWQRDAFSVRGRPLGVIAPTLFALTGAVVAGAVAFGVVLSEAPTLTMGRAVAALLGRLVFDQSIPLPGAVDHSMTAAMHGLGIGLALVGLRAVLLPAVGVFETRHRFDRAAAIVAASTGDSLSYFALRDDKEWFVEHDHLIAYALFGDVCLVSPDPVGPETEADACLQTFLEFVHERGWTPAVLGASPGWLERYERHGLRGAYLGEEAIVRCSRFTLDGRRIKTVREAVNRLTRRGYTAEFFDPAHLSAELRSRLTELAGGSRQGGAERGFSMTLGRLFDVRDRGLLLAVAFDQERSPAAFCQFVPAAALNGYSLDVMRRDLGDHPNGLMDFLVAQTALHLREQGHDGLGLNFAVMKGVLRGEIDRTRLGDAERWLISRFSQGTQIESLYRFNDKFDPEWRPRYLVYRSAADLPAVAMAVARAESLWEIPLIGRFLKTGQRAP